MFEEQTLLRGETARSRVGGKGPFPLPFKVKVIECLAGARGVFNFLDSWTLGSGCSSRITDRETEARMKLPDLVLSSEAVRRTGNGPGWVLKDLGSNPTPASF